MNVDHLKQQKMPSPFTRRIQTIGSELVAYNNDSLLFVYEDWASKQSPKLLKYDLSSKSWNQDQSAPKLRNCSTQCTLGSKLYIFGGFYIEDIYTNLESALVIDLEDDNAEWRQVQDPLLGRIDAAACPISSTEILIVGG